MKVMVDLAACRGYANCLVEAPEVFDIDEETGKALVLVEAPGDDERPAVDAAVRMCPGNAISVED